MLHINIFNSSRISYLILFLILLLCGCATLRYPKFEESNQIFIEKTISKLELGKIVKEKIPQNSKVALVSMETQTTLDKPIIAMIEDQLIQSLLKSDFCVLERDKEVVYNLIKEKINDTYSIIGTTTNYESILFKTHLKSADYLISYRILECGLIYKENPDDLNKISREGLVRLHIRIQDTKNGEIILAKNVEGTFSDEIEKEFVDQLSNFHYSYFPYEYPLQPKQLPVKKTIIRGTKKFSKDKKRYYYCETLLGFGKDQLVSTTLIYGIALGYNIDKLGRISGNYVFNDGKDRIQNITLDYEYILNLTKSAAFLPKLGFGLISGKYYKEYVYNYWVSYWDPYIGSYINYNVFESYLEERQATDLGVVLGGSFEINLAKNIFIKLGYNYYLPLSKKEACNYISFLSIGFKF